MGVAQTQCAQKQKNKFLFSKAIDKWQKQDYIKKEIWISQKNDCDEDGRIEDPGESCRLVRGNGEAFQWLITSESKDRKRKQVDFFRNAA